MRHQTYAHEDSESTDDPVLVAANHWAANARAQIAIVATLAPGPRWLMPIADAAGVTSEHFSQIDCYAIFEALRASRQFPDIERRAALVIRCLRAVDCFDEHDTRPHLQGGMRWGFERVARLFYSFDPDPELVRFAAGALLASAAACESQIKNAERWAA